MGLISAGINALLDRIDNLSPLDQALKDLFKEGNKRAILGGVSPAGVPVAPLKPYTVAHRSGTGPPRAPNREGSRVIRLYKVDVVSQLRMVTITGSWPGFQVEVNALHSGRPNMEARPTKGFRMEDRKKADRMMRWWLIRGVVYTNA
jgi:hypothetical protein